ncbi:hypothetical protein ACHAXH_001811 [Discostella pseudostelligera]
MNKISTMKLLSVLVTGLVVRVTSASQKQVLNAFGEPSYGVDVSFPVHHLNFAQDHQPLGDRRKAYEEFMEGCRQYYSDAPDSCDLTEEDRCAMSVRQPASMQNYTDTGFKKVQAPKAVFDLLSNYWETHYDERSQEKWPRGNTYVNHWAAPTYMVSVEETSLRGGGYDLKRKIWDGVKPILEEWTGMELEPSSMYGIRQYTNGAILNPHADRNPLISSCIINVAQDVEEDWPLEVYGRDGLAYNVTMKPGDMVLYESHSLIHGRPFPLKGKYFANIFIHFNPTGKLLRERDTPVLTDEGEEHMPIYILRGSPDEKKWLREHPPQKSFRHVKESPAAAASPLEELSHAAAIGDIDRVAHFVSNHKDLLHEKDSNGWQPIHEAARGGHLEVVKILLENGGDVNERTNFGEGDSLIELVLDSHGYDHPLFGFLESVGAEL